MQTNRLFSGFRKWLSDLPIEDPVDRSSAGLLQAVLLGLIAILGIASILNLFLLPAPVPWRAVLFQAFISILIIIIPLAALRRGFLQASVWIITSILFLVETYAIWLAGLQEIASTLSFFTLALILAGLLIGRHALTLLFLLTALSISMGILREQDAAARVDSLAVGLNFLLLNGLISLFIGRFSRALRTALGAALQREEELKQEVLSRERTQAALQQSAARLEILHEIDRALITARPMQDIAQDALMRIRQLIPCQRASVSLLDLEKKEASFLAASFHELVRFPTTPISFEEFGQRTIDTLQQNRPWMRDNILDDPQATALDRRLALENNIHAWLSLPLLYQGQLIGALNLGRGPGESFSAEDADIAFDVANQLAIALQQTNLYNALQVELAERKKLISQLEKNNAELERFTYTVSHDLRNPLVTIQGFVGMLRQDMQDGRQDRVHTDLERIENAANKMHRLLIDLLQLSRIGRIHNAPEEIDLNQVVSEAIESLDARLRSRNVTVHAPLHLPTLYADRLRLREVFENLIDNAVKYSGDQPDPIIEIGVREIDNESVFFVRDNGLGIEPQFHNRIFGLFDQLNPRSEGNGIGLAIIKRIIETNGGKIWVESDGLGKGSTFCFTIPNGSREHL